MADQLPIFHVIGFTGHRHIADPAALEGALRRVFGEFTAGQGVEWLALSSAAAGADLAFARAALAQGISWEAILPLAPAAFAQDFSPEDWRQVQSLLAEAEAVRVIGERATREDAYLDCGMETVNRSDLLVAVWDGAPARGRGGTAEIVAYARELRRPLIIVNAHTLAITRENLDRLRSADRHLADLNRLPAAPGERAQDPDRSRHTVREFHLKVDYAASHGAPQSRKLTAATVWLHVLATALAAASLAFHLHHPALPWGKLLCLLGALGVALLLRHHRHQQDWVRCRLAAEITRSALATWGQPRSGSVLDDFDWAGLEPLRRSLEVLQRRSLRRQPAEFAGFKQHYLAERVEGQLAYFARQESRAVPQLARLRFGFTASTVAAIVFTAIYAAHSTLETPIAPHWMETWIFGFGPIVLPVLAAGFISVVSINDLQRRVARYREMHLRLDAARKEASFAQTWGALERVVVRTERALLQEVFEWHSITSFSDSH
jgi:hypothetical protein